MEPTTAASSTASHTDTHLERDLTALRATHVQQDYLSVIQALSATQAPLTAPERALLTLAQLQVGDPAAQASLPEVLAQTPSTADPAWQSDLAAVRLLAGDVPGAMALLQQVCAHPAATAVDCSRLAAAELAAGDLEAAASHYQLALDRDPARVTWQHNLAAVLARQQQYQAALERYEQALRQQPDYLPSREGRAAMLRALERTAELVAEFEAELAAEPTSVAARLRLARALDLDNRFTEAVKTLREGLRPVAELAPATAQQPETELKTEPEPDADEAAAEEPGHLLAEQIQLRQEMARLCSGYSRHGFALLAWEQIEQLAPDEPFAALMGQAQALSELARHTEALDRLARAEQWLSADAERPDTDHSLARAAARPAQQLHLDLVRASISSEQGRYTDAEAILRGLLEAYPGHGGLLSQLGQTLLWTGQLEEAADCFEQASKVNPMALAQMVNARRFPEDAGALETMRRFAENPLAPPDPRAAMAFALAELHDKRKEPDAAWAALTRANRLVAERLPYQAEAFERRVDAMRAVFSAEFFAQQAPIRASDRTPVFVVGMPRSGTTLTEQILCSHPAIFGAGELDLLAQLTRLMPRVLKTRQPFPQGLEQFSPHLREEAARFYLHGLYEYDREHPFVVDKMPHNFMNLGLIALIFPKAKLIHVRRDPRDTALSNYQQNFKMRHGGLGYAFDLEKTARQLNDYHRMMAHWRAVLPMPLFEFRYEDLVADQDGWSRQLLAFVGVDWDASVHDFHKTERAVRTASVTQVRQPIYATSKQKWRRYEAQLAPLLERLNPEVTADWDA